MNRENIASGQLFWRQLAGFMISISTNAHRMESATPPPYRILYVDDEPDNLITFRAAFRRFYEVLTAQSGAEALALLEREPVDLLISDHRMPGMTGVALLERVKVAYPHVIRMMMTGYSDVEAVMDAINQGQAYYYVTKPWRLEALRLVFDNALEALALRRRTRQLEAERNRLALAAAEQERLMALSRYDALSRQLNPHFLFNSLNVLASLIPRDSRRAQLFVQHFSKVYRGLLEQPEAPLVTLEQEADFARAYLQLMEMRFEGSLFVHWNLAPDRMAWRLPPFALQLLVENAIKHNIIAEDEPLHIRIDTEDDELAVRNNLQTRLQPPDSPQLGLRNLAERLALLTTRLPAFGAAGDEYQARLPLLPPPDSNC